MSAEPEAPKDAALLGCPFCGGEAEMRFKRKDGKDQPYVDCLYCWASTPLEPSSCPGATEDDRSQVARLFAIDAWNRRAGLPAAAPATNSELPYADPHVLVMDHPRFGKDPDDPKGDRLLLETDIMVWLVENPNEYPISFLKLADKLFRNGWRWSGPVSTPGATP